MANEFGLGSLAVGSIVLTHPKRLSHSDDLRMDCPGDESFLRADSDFSKSPSFYFCSGQVSSSERFVSELYGGHFGSVSSFLPQ